MTFSLAVVNGDLAMVGSEMSIVSGVDKLAQDISLWVAETYGIDRFHPRMGSQLQNWIGSIIGAQTNAAVQHEIMRVLRNYERVQARGFKESPQMYSMSELLYSINSIKVATGYDTVTANVNVSNAELAPVNVAVTQAV